MSLVAVAFGALVAAAPVSAGTLDQAQTDTSGGGFTVSKRFTPGQTFTAGLTGVLDQVDLWVTRKDDPGCAPPGDLSVQIRAITPGGLPTGHVIAASPIGRPAVPIDLGVSPTPTPPVAARFASPPNVAAEAQYAIVVSETNGAADSSCYRWYSSTVDVYPRGIGFGGDEGVFTPADSPTDLAFRTYVFVSCRGQEATRVGTAGDDEITGTPERDVVAALGGRDKVSGLAGNDLICGGTGKDTLTGGKGKDKLLGQQGADRLKGGKGNDACRGGKGRDLKKSC